MKLADNRESEGVARAVAHRLLAAADDAIAGNVEVASENRDLFLATYGWWQMLCRSAKVVLAVTLLDDGFSFELAPVVRNIFNYGIAIHWQVDNGLPAVNAVVAKGDKDRRKLVERMEATGWADASAARKAVDEYEAQHPTPTRTPTEQKLHDNLVHEFGNFYALLERYGSSELYPVYSHLSALSHPSVDTAGAFLERRDDGTYELRHAPAGLGHAYVIQAAISLLQAAAVVSALLKGDPLRLAIDQALADLGLGRDDLLPVRAK